MKKSIVIILFVFLAACNHKKDIPEILLNEFDIKVISSDNSAPSINLDEDHLKEMLVLLHNNFSAEEIKKYFQLTDELYNEKINKLFGEGLVKKVDDRKFIPTCMVISIDEGKEIKKFADSLGREMSSIAIDRIAKIKEEYSKISSFKNFSFEETSLFVLGEVIHNHWQMNAIEERYIKSFPPHRGASRYYLSIQEVNAAAKTQPFGIYNDKFVDYGGYVLGIYGNRKFEHDFMSQTNDDLVKYFGLNATDKITDLKKVLIEELVKQQRNPKYVVSKNHLNGFANLNFMKDGKITIPVVAKEDNKKLYGLASIITNDLINYLERNRPMFVKMFLNSAYKDQTSFREWFAWIYQFIISETVNQLIAKGYIKTPTSNNACFVLLK